MERDFLRKYQKDDTFKCVQEAGLNPLRFRWDKEKTDFWERRYYVPVLRYIATHFHFKFDWDRMGNFACSSCPGRNEWVEDLQSTESWDTVLDQFKDWLSSLKDETAPDLWEKMKEYTPDEILIGTREISNAPFSHSEAENIIGSLDKLQAEIENNFDLQGDQLAFLKARIDYLKDAAKRQGRKDWMHTSIGVIVGIAASLALSPENAKLLWDLVKSCFAGLLPLPAP